jgi:N4-gp56 family major capsid protein
VEHGLRAAPLYRNFADKRPVQVTGPSATVTLHFYTDLAVDPVNSILTEYADPDPITLSNTTSVTITAKEYGASGFTTRKAELTALSDIDTELLDQIVWNMQDTLDWHSQAAFVGGGSGGSSIVVTAAAGVISALAAGSGATNYGSTGAGTGTGCTGIAGTQLLTAKQIRYGVTKLRAAKVPGRKGNLYCTVLNPEASADLREETGMAAWRDPHAYSAPGNIWDGELGAFEGSFFIESPRNFNAMVGSGSGATQVRVFNTYMFGQQFLAEAIGQDPHVEYGPITDKLNRFRPVGWYGFLGWAPYRAASFVQFNHATSARPNV